MTAKSPTAKDASQIQNREGSSSPLAKPLLRHKEDLRQLACTALFFGFFAWTWANFSSPLSGGLISFASWLALAQLSFMGAVATHNAIHTPLFWSRRWNSFYQVCLSLQYGFPVSVFIPGHNLSHHKHTQQARDFMRTTKVHYRWHFLNGLLFFWHVVLTSPDDEKLYFAVQARKNRPIARQRRIEQAVVVGAAVMLVLLSWRRFIWFALLPQLYAKYCLVTLNLLQHDGCDNSSDVNFARNFTGSTLNYLCFNNGYHTIHHRFPGMHWSVLPQKHQELIAPHIAPSLVEPSILGYIWRTFVWPGVRLDWRGKPLVITQEEKEMKDLPWNYNQDESYSIKSDEY